MVVKYLHMSEKQENLAAILSKVSSFDDLQTALPPSLTSKLGEGEVGVKRAMGMLIGLVVFAPGGTFDRAAFDNIIAVDYDTDKLLPPEEAQKMFGVCLETGIINQVESRIGTRYQFNPQLHAAMIRLME